MTTSILVVDDSTVSRMMIKAIIKEQLPDAAIVEASSGDDALTKVAGLSFDMAIVDYNMPGMNGLELFEALASRTTIARRALLTANIQTAIVERAKQAGVVFLNKPISETVVVPFLLNQ